MREMLLSFDTAAPGLLLAFVAGLVNSLSPCCLAMTPAFLAHLAGVETDGPSRRAGVVRHAGVYVAGFTLVFVAIGVGASLAGLALVDQRPILFKVGGTLVIVFGLIQMGVFKFQWLQRSYEVSAVPVAAPGYTRSFLVGATYSLGWTPCIGPVLGAILTSAVVFGDVWQGVLLLGAFAAGLAIPHLGAAVAFERIRPLRLGVQRHYVLVQRVSGTVMVGMGVLIFTGALIEIFRYFQGFNVVL